MKKLYMLAIIFMLAFNLHAQLVVDSSQPAAQVVEDVFLANGIFVANVVYTGFPEQIGTFDASAANVGIGSGIMMASGDIAGAIGPNNNSAMTLGGGNYGGSDADLAILSGFPLNDASVVEFDFIATGDSLDFQFVFGSEEYPEYTNSAFNDVFGFFISGPGINGTFTNNSINIAQIPGTTLPVAIDNLNNGSDGLNGPCEYCEYYIYNGGGWDMPWMADTTVIQCDGFTTLLHAAIGQLQVGETYHIKLAIADASDGAFDSFVFLAGDSFVQFCTEEVGFMPDLCMLSHLHAEFDYTGECGEVVINNYSDINIDFTNCYIETGDGGTLDACTPGLEYNYELPGTYTLNLVYEVNEFHAQFEIGQVTIASTPPPTPEIMQQGELLTATNYDSSYLIQWYLDSEPIPNAISETLVISQSGTYSVAFTNSCGTISSTENVNFQGIEGLTLSPVNVYPNPSDGLLTVKSIVPNVMVNIYDYSGKLIYQEICNGSLIIDLDVAPGLYSMDVLANGSKEILMREKIVIR